MAEAQSLVDATTATFEDVKQALGLTMSLAGGCHDVYLGAPTLVRRRLNQTFFDRIWVFPEDRVEITLASPFHELAPFIQRAAANASVSLGHPWGGPSETDHKGSSRDPHVVSVGNSWNMNALVPSGRFERPHTPPEGDALSPELRGQGPSP